jgi:hypothetical protein
MASERIRHAQTPDGDWVYVPSPTGDHITLPLDPAQYDAAAVEAANEAYWRAIDSGRPSDAMLDALAAYARHVAGGAR